MNVRADIRLANVLFELSLVQQGGGLRSGSANNQIATRRVQLVGQLFESQQAGGVDRRHVPQPQDDDRRELIRLVGDLPQLLRRPEQERSVDAEHRDVVGNRLVLQDVQPPLLDIFVA